MKPTVRQIQESIAADFNVPEAMFFSTDRHFALSHPRQYAMLLAAEITGHSVANLGRLFNMDRTSVSHGIARARRRVRRDRNLALKLGARKLLLECQPQLDPFTQILRRIPDPSARKTVIMSKWQRGEITPERASKLIRLGGLVNA